MRRLLPPSPSDHVGPDVGSDVGPDVDLDQVYAYPGSVDQGRAWLRANMVSSLDGAAQGPDGLSAGLSSPADKKLFGALRGLADVVVVGASTVREEGYRPPQPKAGYADARAAAGRLPVPVIAIVTRSLGLDFSAPLFTEALVPPVILTCSSADPDALERARAVADVVVAGDEEVDLAQAVKILAARGWTRMLTEGGPHLLAGLVAAEVVDEVCLALGPLLTAGDATRMLAGPLLETPQRFGLESLLEEDGFLFGRYVRRTDG